ncbi:MAG: sigma-54 interaction domain-containing protein [Oscillospiraceae bacterium]
MEYKYNCTIVSGCKQEFFHTGKIDPTCVSPEIASSWIRSKKYGVVPDSLILPVGKAAVKDKLIGGRATYNRNSWLKMYMESEAAQADKLHIVLVTVDENLNLIDLNGNADIIRKLKKSGIEAGINLSESNVGTNAAALAHMYGKEILVTGEEHYCDAFCDYVSFANWMVPEMTSNFVLYSTMILIPVKYFHIKTLPVLRHFLTTRDSFKLCQQAPLQVMRGRLIELCMETAPVGYFIIDAAGVILEYNALALELLGSRAQTEQIDYLQCCYPQLEYVIDHMRRGDRASGKTLYINDTVGNVKIRYFPTTATDGTVVGAILILAKPNILPPFQNKPEISAAIRPKNGEHRAKYTFGDIYSASPAFLAQIDIAKKAAGGESNVLILGESGTGKELIAQSIHNASSRREKPFVAVNCAAIPKELLSSELFGYVEGAFTGARKNGAPGKIELADGGTLYLDEIGDMPMDMQVYLLRILEERVISRLGETKERPVDVRIIASTNKNPKQLIEAGLFRLDLYYRLNVVSVTLPPLRERPEDIKLLAENMLFSSCRSLGKDFRGIAPEALEKMTKYNWPGNGRELRNVVERFTALTDNEFFTADDLPAEIRSLKTRHRVQAEPDEIQLPAEPKMSDREKISALLKSARGNKSLVAEQLGISRPTLYRWMREWNLPEDRAYWN